MTAPRAFGWRLPRLPVFGFKAAPGGWGFPSANIDLRPLARFPRDQLWTQSCVGQSVGRAVDFAVDRAMRSRVWSGSAFTASALGIYWRARAMEGTTNDDAGASIADAVTSLGQGVISEGDWAFDVQNVTKRPTPGAETRGALVRVVNSSALAHDADTITSVIAGGYPVIFGCTVYESFASTEEHMPWPEPGERVLGGHAMLAVGVYPTAKGRRVRVLNSWGRGFGKDGCCTMPLEYLTNPGLTGELYVIRAVAEIPPGA